MGFGVPQASHKPKRIDPGGHDWMIDAVCRSVGPDLFFPNENKNGTGMMRGRGAASRLEQARTVCAACPVQSQCLSYARAHGEQWGIWGGIDFSVPDRDRSTPRTDAGCAPCGTAAAARRHYRHGTPLCAACREAAAREQKAKRAKQS